MRISKLLVSGAALLALMSVPVAQASEDAIPEGAIQAPDANAPAAAGDAAVAGLPPGIVKAETPTEVAETPEALPEAAGPAETAPEVAETPEALPEAAEPAETAPEAEATPEAPPEVAEPAETQPETAEPAETPPEVAETAEAPPEVAETAETAPETPGDSLAIEPSADVEPIQAAESAAEPAAVAVPMAGEPAPKTVLGAVGYDSQGRRGRIHIVVPGDTLWDISEAYLGTPWVWPSIWTDNREIENPHLIHPGDRIWITDYEMRIVSTSEAEALLAGKPAALEDLSTSEPEPVAEPASDVAVVPEEQPTRHVSDIDEVGLISAEELEAAASIVRAVPLRVMLSQGDRVYVGLGEGDVSTGDRFTVFRANEKVFDPDTGHFLGHHVEILGWLEVLDVFDETSLAEIKQSVEDMGVGDRLIRRKPPVYDVVIQASPEAVEGKISFFPKRRVMMGTIDYVYLNRGTLDGLEVGSPLEVYRAGSLANETVRSERVYVPDRVIAKLLVVSAEPESSVAFVTHTETELELGDRFRGETP